MSDDDMHGVSDEQLHADLEAVVPILRKTSQTGATPALRESASRALAAVEDAIRNERQAE